MFLFYFSSWKPWCAYVYFRAFFIELILFSMYLSQWDSMSPILWKPTISFDVRIPENFKLKHFVKNQGQSKKCMYSNILKIPPGG